MWTERAKRRLDSETFSFEIDEAERVAFSAARAIAAAFLVESGMLNMMASLVLLRALSHTRPALFRSQGLGLRWAPGQVAS